MESQSPKQDHAIVIGGSMAGLLAARVLAGHYQRVTVLERDTPPERAENRRGVPQGRHAHGILSSGRQVLERLFPGVSAQMEEKGALPGDIGRTSRWFLEGGCLARTDSGLDALLVSRPLLESTVRSRVKMIPNVDLQSGETAQDLLTSADRRRVVGVRAGSTAIEADLVVDASGRGSHAPQWLEALGYQRPREERMEINLKYATRHFRRAAEDLGGDLAAVIPPQPDQKRGGVMLAQEGARWIVTLVGHFSENPPADLEGFLEYAKSLPAPFIYQVIRHAEPLDEGITARYPASVWRRYDGLSRFPEQFLTFGDAICSFNPRFGQGMSVAALQAETLAQCLEQPGAGLAQRFFGKAAAVIATPWTLAAGNDLRMPEVQGQRTFGSKLINGYMAKLLKAAQHDPEISLAFHRVTNLLAAPPTLMSPAMMWRVLRANLGGSRAKAEVLRYRTHN